MKSNEFLDKNTAIEKMNHFGSLKIPFFFLVSFDTERCLVLPTVEIDPSLLQYSIQGWSNATSGAPRRESFIFTKHILPYSVYLQRFTKVRKNLALGNTYLLNLTCPTQLECDLSLKEMFDWSKAKYKIWLKDLMVVFSPETFIEIRNGIIYSYPMKGTIRADLPSAREKLLSDPKEIAEHYTIVDLIRNDLSRVAGKVHVEDFRYVENIETNQGPLLQTSSRISGIVRGEYLGKPGDLLFKLLPAGSVSGAPKEKTVRIIQETEEYDRGFYTGVAGIFDGYDLYSGVLIRFIEASENGLVFKSGGGITVQSEPELEYLEMINKVYVPFT